MIFRVVILHCTINVQRIPKVNHQIAKLQILPQRATAQIFAPQIATVGKFYFELNNATRRLLQPSYIPLPLQCHNYYSLTSSAPSGEYI